MNSKFLLLDSNSEDKSVTFEVNRYRGAYELVRRRVCQNHFYIKHELKIDNRDYAA